VDGAEPGLASDLAPDDQDRACVLIDYEVLAARHPLNPLDQLPRALPLAHRTYDFPVGKAGGGNLLDRLVAGGDRVGGGTQEFVQLLSADLQGDVQLLLK